MLQNIALTSFGHGVKLAGHIFFWVLAARWLGPFSLGEFSIALLVPTVLVAALTFGLPAANIYFVCSGSLTARGRLFDTLTAWAILSALGVTIAAAVILFMPQTVFPHTSVLVLWLALLLFPILLLHTLLSSLLQAQQRFAALNIVLVCPYVIAPAAAATIYVLLDFNAANAILAWGSGHLAAVAICLWLLKDLLCTNGSEVPRDGRHRLKWLWYGWQSYLTALMMFLNYRADLYILSLIGTSTAVGIYTLATQIAERLWILSFAASTVLLPRLSQLGQNEALRSRLTPLACRLVALVAIVGALIFAALAKPVIPLLFGPGYEEATTALICLLPGVAALAAGRLLLHDIAARGRPDLNVWTAAITLGINIIGNLVLIPRYGMAGAAIATSVAYIVATLGSVLIYMHLSGNRLRPWISTVDGDLTLLRQAVEGVVPGRLSNFAKLGSKRAARRITPNGPSAR